MVVAMAPILLGAFLPHNWEELGVDVVDHGLQAVVVDPLAVIGGHRRQHCRFTRR
jgi:hypothetical protein